MEFMALMKGELEKVRDFKNRTKKLIAALIAGRPMKEFHSLWRSKLEGALTIPDELIEHLETFDIESVLVAAD